MSDRDEFGTFRPRPRPSESVTLSIPTDTLASIRRVAAARDMSPEALLKFYIGQGLRQDVAREKSSVVHRDPEILGGTPVFVGTRVPLKNLMDYLEGGHSLDDFLDDLPSPEISEYRSQAPRGRRFWLRQGCNARRVSP
ncbi:MAG TPA: DUF433 domain-containing protein [Longimicrobium sp.]|nr:DUF433 domain-containing protein [Longimicrobium sp.]